LKEKTFQNKMTHLKRITMPKTWPLARKGYKYIVKPLAGKKIEFCLPAMIILRNILKIGRTRKEIKKILQEKDVLVNGKIISEEAYPVGFYDIISLPKMEKYYRIELSGKGKLSPIEISKEKAMKRYSKIVNKTIIKKNKIQINFQDGLNTLAEKNLQAKVNDCIVFDLQNKKILKIIPFEKGSHVIIIGGKHCGKEGNIEKIEGDITTVKTNSNSIKTIKQNLFVCEK